MLLVSRSHLQNNVQSSRGGNSPDVRFFLGTNWVHFKIALLGVLTDHHARVHRFGWLDKQDTYRGSHQHDRLKKIETVRIR